MKVGKAIKRIDAADFRARLDKARQVVAIQNRVKKDDHAFGPVELSTLRRFEQPRQGRFRPKDENQGSLVHPLGEA